MPVSMFAPTLPPGYRARPVSSEDLAAMIAIGQACDVVAWGEVDGTEGFVRDMVALPEMDFAADSIFVEADDGAPAAFGWLLARDEHRRLDADGFVHPEHRGRGVGSAMIDFFEARADDHLALAPPGEVLLHIACGEPERDAAALILSRGYEVTRHFWRMDIDVLASPIPAATFPPGIEVRSFRREEDARRVHRANGEAFAEHWGFVERTFEDWEAHRIESPEFDPTLWWIAWANGSEGEEVAGFLQGGIAVEDGRGWVHSLGVRKPWRGQGIAKALLYLAFAEYAHRRIREVSLEVDADNATGATELYRRVGMHVAQQFDAYRKQLR
jgi:mycothiol synthase